VRSRGQICKFWNPFRKFRTGVARNFKFGTQLHLGMSHLKYEKLPHRGHGGSSGAEFLHFGPQSKFEMHKARNFKFCTQIDVGKSHHTDNKIP